MSRLSRLMLRLLAIADIVVGLGLLLVDLAPGLFGPSWQWFGHALFGSALLAAGVLALIRPWLGLPIGAGTCLAMAAASGLAISGLSDQWGSSEGFGRLGIVVFTVLAATMTLGLLGAAWWHGLGAAIAAPDRKAQVIVAVLGSAVLLFGISRSGCGAASARSPGSADDDSSARPIHSLEMDCARNHPTACGELFWRRYRANDLEGMQKQSGVLCRRGIAYHCFALGDVAQALGRHDEAARYYEQGCLRDRANCRRQRGADPGPLP